MKLVYGKNLVNNKQNSCGCSHKGYVTVKKRQYKCVETGEVFSSSVKAARFAGVSNGWQIVYACDGRLKSTGFHPETGERLHWEFVDVDKKKFVGKTANYQHKLVCVNTGKRYVSAKQAARSLGFPEHMAKYIQDVCNHYRWSAGKDPETGEPLVWEWI